MLTIQNISAMEPLMISGSSLTSELSDIIIDLIAKSERLKSKFSPTLQASITDTLRSMNCYYSNFIEGHNTHPIDIERALIKDFSTDIKKRNLQLEAYSHIALQRKIDSDHKLQNITTPEYFLWLHQEFCALLPDEMRIMENPETQEKIHLIPGKFRDSSVIIGNHIPVNAEVIPRFLTRFHECYAPENLNRTSQLIAAAASHHRFLWIHPFYDGNGRVARLFSHAYLRKIGICNGLWSISRGLARHHTEYKKLLMRADIARQSNYDGRGALSEAALQQFCLFFLQCCIDQVEFMDKLLQPETLLKRIERWTQQQIDKKELPNGSYYLLKEALLRGQFERGEAANLTKYKDRQARTVLNALTKKGLLISDTPKGPVRLAFPSIILEDWLPKLFLG